MFAASVPLPTTPNYDAVKKTCVAGGILYLAKITVSHSLGFPPVSFAMGLVLLDHAYSFIGGLDIVPMQPERAGREYARRSWRTVAAEYS